MAEYRIVIDQSTSKTKALLVRVSGGTIKIIERMDKSHRQIYPEPGWVEHNPIEIFENVKELINKILQSNNLKKENVLSLSIVNQRETIVIWDKETGEPIINALVWQCNRSEKICKSLIENGFEEIIQDNTGLKIDNYFSGPKIKWVFDNYDLVEKSNIVIGTIDTWLIWNLTNREVFATEPSNASRTLLYNIHKQEWDKKLCEIFNVSKGMLPEILSSNSNFGFYEGIPIVGVMGDSQAALYGHKLTKRGDVKATLGTGCSILMNNGGNSEVENSTIIQTVAWKKNNKLSYALEGVIKSCTDTLNWLQNELNLFNTIGEGSKMAFSILDSEGVYLIPGQLGLAAPFWEANTKASFIGMTRSNTNEHLIRAAFDSMVFQIKAVIDEMEKETKIKIGSIKVDGGASKNNDLIQLMSDVLQKKIIIEEVEELSALGILMLSFDVDIDRKHQQIFKPKTNKEHFYSDWLEHVKNYLNIERKKLL